MENDFSQKAKEMNDKIFGPERRGKTTIEEGLKEQVNENMRYSLSVALSQPWVSAAQKQSFVSVLKEQKDAVNILFAQKSEKGKVAQMLRPIFGPHAGKFLTNFQKNFDSLQKALLKDLGKK